MHGPARTGWIERPLEDLVQILDSQRIPINNKERQGRLAASEKRFPYYGATGQVGEIDDFLFAGTAVLLGEDAAPFLDPYKAKAYLVSGRYWVNNHAHILRGNGGIDNAFLCHQLNVLNYRGYVSGTTRLKLTQASMKELPIRVPPLNEQQRIVEKIETLFARLDKGEEAVRGVQKLLTRYRQSVLKSAVTGQLTADWRAARAGQLEHGRDLLERVLQDRRKKWEARGSYKEPFEPSDADLPELPNGWAWCVFDQLISHLTSGSRDWKQYYGRGEGIFIMAQNVRPMRFDLSERFFVDPPSESPDAKRSEVRRGDLLITIVGANTGDICRFASDAKAHYVCQSVALARPVETDMSEYLEVYLASAGAGRDELEKFIYGAGRPHLSFEQLRTVAVPLPSLEEQAEILAIVSEHLDKINKLDSFCETELKRSASLRQSILKDAFAGKLVPQDPAEEPASALLARIAADEIIARKTCRKTSA